MIYLSYYQFIQTFAASIDIMESTYKLSTEVQYAIYERHTNDFMGDGAPNEQNDGICTNLLYNFDIIDPNKNENFKWTIVPTKEGYSLKNVGTGRSLSIDPDGAASDNRYCSGDDWNGYIFITQIQSTWNEPYYSWQFYQNSAADDYHYNSQSLPVIHIIPVTHPLEHIISHQDWIKCNYRDWDVFPNNLIFGPEYNYVLYHHPIFPEPEMSEPDEWNADCIKQLGWVFIPLSLPSNCESMTTDPSEPNEFKSLTSQISSSLSTSITNAGSFQVPYSTPERTECKEFTTTFTRTQGSEMSFGFSIKYESPETSFGKLEAEYHMDWKYYEQTVNTRTDTNSACISFPSVDSACPPRTICKRIVTTYKPPLSNIEFTINAVCDGNEYTTKGLASVDGIVRIEYIDQSLPMDCQYYTTDYNIFEPGTLQFCDTCNNDKTCEICRDGYILLDGVCITEATCEIICGGKVRGGKYFEILGGLGPWSGGFCQIYDQNKYLSNSCRHHLNGATAEQNNAPSLIDDTLSNGGDECVAMYGQCGGIDYNGPINCCQYSDDEREWKCRYISDWHSQCDPF